MYTEDQIKQALITAYYQCGPLYFFFDENNQLAGDWADFLVCLKSAEPTTPADENPQPLLKVNDKNNE